MNEITINIITDYPVEQLNAIMNNIIHSFSGHAKILFNSAGGDIELIDISKINNIENTEDYYFLYPEDKIDNFSYSTKGLVTFCRKGKGNYKSKLILLPTGYRTFSKTNFKKCINISFYGEGTYYSTSQNILNKTYFATYGKINLHKEKHFYYHSDIINNRYHYNQRMEWISFLGNRLYGGIVDSPNNESLEYSNLKILFPAFKSKFVQRLSFKEYWEVCRNSYILSCPAGQARWTYRHYEAMINKCLCLSTDHKEYEFLMELPDYLICKDFENPCKLINEDIRDFYSTYINDINYWYDYYRENINLDGTMTKRLFDKFINQFD